MLLTLVSGSWDGVWLLVAVDLALLVALMLENVRVENLRRAQEAVATTMPS